VYDLSIITQANVEFRENKKNGFQQALGGIELFVEKKPHLISRFQFGTVADFYRR
jgi:hypothetical protein